VNADFPNDVHFIFGPSAVGRPLDKAKKMMMMIKVANDVPSAIFGLPSDTTGGRELPIG